MDDTVSALNSAGAKFGMLWIDVEGTSYWSSTPSKNVDFIQSMVDEGLKKNVSLGMWIFRRYGLCLTFLFEILY
jgi:hypothetical protein